MVQDARETAVLGRVRYRSGGGEGVRRVLAEEVEGRRERTRSRGRGVLAYQGLNFEFGDYSAVAPVIDAMSLEDVVTAVRQGKLREHYA